MNGDSQQELELLRRQVESLRSEIRALRVRHRETSLLTAKYLRGAGFTAPDSAGSASDFADILTTVAGGEDVADGDLPECAAVGLPGTSLGFDSSGVLVARRVVVTAAHGTPPTAAALPVTKTSHITNQQVFTGHFVPNPQFNGNGPDDIAVMILNAEPNVNPVPLASTAEMIAADQVLIAGFGADDLAATEGFGVKRSATVPVQFLAGGPFNKIPKSLKPGDFDPATEFVAGLPKSGACLGDSGGPVYIMVGNERKVAGIVSRRPHANPVCKGLTICTRIDAFAKFISDHTP